MIVTIILSVGAALIMFLVGWFVRKRVEHQKLDSAERMAESILTEAAIQAETIKKTAELEVKDEAYRIRADFERESNAIRQEFQRTEKRIAAKEQNLDRKADFVAKKDRDLQRQEQSLRDREKALGEKGERLEALIQQQNDQLERVAGMTTEEAKRLLLSNIERRVREDAAQITRSIIEEARQGAEYEAKEIITQAIQRCALDHVVETTVSVVVLPDDEMKGRIIGREGRNIRAFEMATGIDVIVDDTPRAVVLSGFDPMRREIARMSLEKLIQDGRIHPGFIEQVVAKSQEELEDLIRETGNQTLFELGIHGMRPELASMVGRLKYRMTCGQNALHHSREVARLAGLMAEELALDTDLAKRGGLLHDIGKAVDSGPEGTHTELGHELARKYGEPPEVLECIGLHHTDLDASSPIAALVQAADALSVARPGAPREPLEKFINRLRKLEALVGSFEGVSKAYAVKAGQEVRVIVDHEQVDDFMAVQLSSDIARKIQVEMEYPGQIKVTLIRETRAIEYAK
jgi:ribonuclease Y